MSHNHGIASNRCVSVRDGWRAVIMIVPVMVNICHYRPFWELLSFLPNLASLSLSYGREEKCKGMKR